MDSSILKTGVPAAIVVSVLGFSMLFPAAVSQGNRGNQGDDNGYGERCGYGQVQDNDENDKSDGGGGGESAKTARQMVGAPAVLQLDKEKGKDKHDNDCNEDEDDNGGGGGGGDQGILSRNQAGLVQVATVGGGLAGRLGGDGE